MARPVRDMNRSSWAALISFGIVLLTLGSWGLSLGAWRPRGGRESQTRPLPSDDPTYTVNVRGRERTFIVHTPGSSSSARPMPVVLAFHGGRGSGQRMVNFTGFNKLSDTYGFIVVYPNGYQSSWNDGRGSTEAERAGIDDIAFVKAMIDDLGRRFTIDQKRIYATGVSNGGMFSNRLGCELSDQLAGIAVVIGPMPAPIAPRCEPQRPISVLGVFGTEDPAIPWRGGEVQVGARGPILGVEATIDLWVKKNACQSPAKIEALPTRVADGTTVKRTTYGVCKEGRDVVLYTIEGGGHAWPPAGPAVREVAGRSSRNLDASQVIWDFFAGQPPR